VYGTGTVPYRTVLRYRTGTVRFSNRTHPEKKDEFCQCQIFKQTRKPTIFEAQLVLGAARENVKLELSDTPAIINTIMKDNFESKYGFYLFSTM
jgi:hypothetical protein